MLSVSIEKKSILSIFTEIKKKDMQFIAHFLLKIILFQHF